MRLRAILAVQLLIALSVMGIIAFVVAATFWRYYGQLLPAVIPVAQTDLPLFALVLAYGGILLFLTACVLIFVFLFIDHIFIRPIKEITRSMSAFNQTNTFTPLAPVATGTREVRELVNSYVTFTDRVAQAHERDQEISRVKSDFISTAAHQLRTPLTGIRWALEALAKQPLNEQQKMLIDDAASKSRDLVAIVGTLLDISSIESGKHKYVFVEAALEDIVAAVVNDFQRQAQEQGVSLIFKPPEGPLPHVRVDRDQIKWVLNNLVENAIRYTPSGGSVIVTVESSFTRVLVKVRDTGIGIPVKDRNNIFERFYRAENAISKENKGNGLGLYISRTVATDHGGDLNFAPNENGPGTTFTLSLPRIQS